MKMKKLIQSIIETIEWINYLPQENHKQKETNSRK
jgi:hypothetical protein